MIAAGRLGHRIVESVRRHPLNSAPKKKARNYSGCMYFFLAFLPPRCAVAVSCHPGRYARTYVLKPARLVLIFRGTEEAPAPVIRTMANHRSLAQPRPLRKQRTGSLGPTVVRWPGGVERRGPQP